MNDNLNLPSWDHRINHKNEYVRIISGFFILALLVLPLPFYLFIFREGYSNAARVGWGLYTLLIWPLLVAIVFWLFVGIVFLTASYNASSETKLLFNYILNLF